MTTVLPSAAAAKASRKRAGAPADPSLYSLVLSCLAKDTRLDLEQIELLHVFETALGVFAAMASELKEGLGALTQLHMVEAYDHEARDDEPGEDQPENAYRQTLEEPEKSATQLNDFLGVGLDVEAMATVVDPALYRNRG